MSSDNRVYVLGAGFTKAFAPNAPLLIDNYDLDGVRDEFCRFPFASQILENERRADGKLDIERLMTRLHAGMPYDQHHRVNHELALLLERIKDIFVKRLSATVREELHLEELAAFAAHVIASRATCITFNYDDLLDEALWRVRSVHFADFYLPAGPYWHPDGGYGFYCRPSSSCVRDRTGMIDLSTSRLLKLHGSTNWFPRRGSRPPYALDSIVHHEYWLPANDEAESQLRNASVLEHHLEQTPFIIPPVLAKASDLAEPVITMIWSSAFESLRQATEVVFIGYSFPVTDLSARFLFTETLAHESQKVRVVNYADEAKERERIKRAYRRVFPALTDGQFEFDGARAWAQCISELNG